MKNVLDKSCRENKNTHLRFNNVFPKIAPFMRQCRKIWWRPKDHMTSQYGSYVIIKAIYTYAHAHTHAPGYPHARTHNHAHTNQYVIPIAFPQQQWFRERASVLGYTYIASIVLLYYLLVGWGTCTLIKQFPRSRSDKDYPVTSCSAFQQKVVWELFVIKKIRTVLKP